jgi:integrase/recombinase XerD
MSVPALQRCFRSSLDSLAHAVADHLVALEALGYASSTIRCRRRYLMHFCTWARAHAVHGPADVSLPALERYRLAVFRLRQLDGGPLGRGAQVQRLLAVKGLLRWCVRQGMIPWNPAAELQLPRREEVLPRAVLSAEEAEAVLAMPNLSTPCGVRDRAVLETFYCSGLRRSELACLRLADLDAVQRLVWIRRGKGGRDRIVPIGSRALHWVRRYLGDVRPGWVRGAEPGFLFLTGRGGPLKPGRLSERVARYVDAAAVGKRGSCHLFRHTMATLMLEGGADIRWIQAMLGHAQLSTTARYTRVAIGQLQRVHARTHPAGG